MLQMALGPEELSEDALLGDQMEKDVEAPPDDQDQQRQVSGKRLRRSDPLRTEIWEVIQKQAALAIERMRAMLEQLKADWEQSLQMPTTSKNDEMLRLLEVAGLSTVDQLEGFMEKSMRKSEKLMQVCEMVKSEEEEIIKAVAELTKRVETMGRQGAYGATVDEFNASRWDKFRNLRELVQGDTTQPFQSSPRAVALKTGMSMLCAIATRAAQRQMERQMHWPQLSMLTMKEGQSVAGFCLVLGKLAARAYPDFRQLAGWDGSYRMAEAIETALREETYEKVKEVALRLERSKQVVSKVANTRKLGGHHRNGPPLAVVGKESFRSRVRYEPQERSQEGVRTRVTVELETMRRAQIEQGNHQGNESTSLRCFKCGKQGHKARQCQECRKTELQTVIPNEPRGEQRRSFSALLNRLLCTSSVAEALGSGELFGKMSTAKIELMGMEVEALLDTGSETSIVPLELFRLARERQVDIDAFVERIPGVETVVRNASGEQMKFVDTIRMPVKLNGEICQVAFHVGSGLGVLVILGTNALKLFGIELRGVDGQPIEEKPVLANTKKREQTCETTRSTDTVSAVVQERVFLPPKALKKIKLSGSPGVKVFWSKDSMLSHGCCEISANGVAEIPVLDTSGESKVFQRAQIVGNFETEEVVPIKAMSDHEDMLDNSTTQCGDEGQRLELLKEILAKRNTLTPDEIPTDRLNLNFIDYDDYKHELLNSIQLAWESAKELNEEYRARKKDRYDTRCRVRPEKLPQVGDRVYVKAPYEKAASKYPKFCHEREGPFRVIESSENSAFFTNLLKNEEPIRIQHGQLIVLPPEIDDTPVRTKTKRTARVKKKCVQDRNVNAVCFRSGDDEDSAALSLFFTCPGQGRVNEQHEDYHCTVRGMTFGSVVPDEDDVISALPITSIYALARYFTIYENEPNMDSRRYLMADQLRVALSVAGAQKAYLFFKHKCEHVSRAFLGHDGSFVILTYGGGLKVGIEQLTDLVNARITYAKAHSWREVDIKGTKAPVLFALPAGFRCFQRVIKNINEYVKFLLYDGLEEVYRLVRAYPASRLFVFVSPATEMPVEAKEWNVLSATLAA
ncbi:zinc knuckle [Oesophagostomum dentatum]|uniref:Zinc knuckle n=1 Tax=Oesophagostomum dentatum TaxID=61180 RepID=A0A0B1TMG5_OESDE|nr:zinc knuckle [Oesophagostomum dentatum]